MKGKFDIRFASPNVARLRSRLENPPQELTSDLRDALKSAVVTCLNEANLAIKAKMIDYINSRTDLKYKSKQHQAQVCNLTSGIFETVFAADAKSLNDLIGEEAEEAEGESAEGDTADVCVEATEAPVAKVKPAKGNSAPAEQNEFDA